MIFQTNHPEYLGQDFDPSGSSESLYARLKEVDPERSGELMPSQRRKVVRSLQGESRG